jgi:hypothetical protein
MTRVSLRPGLISVQPFRAAGFYAGERSVASPLGVGEFWGNARHRRAKRNWRFSTAPG